MRRLPDLERLGAGSVYDQGAWDELFSLPPADLTC